MMTGSALYLAIGFLAGLAIHAGIAAQLSARRRRRARVVEMPNSAYTSKLVRDRETQRSWEAIPLEVLHEINREEARRLIARVAEHGIDALKPSERTFLETLASNTAQESALEDAWRTDRMVTSRDRPATGKRHRQELHPPF